MASYQPHLQQLGGRKAEMRYSVGSLDSSWIVAELARATNENVFSDTLSSPVSDIHYSLDPESEQWAEQVSCHSCSLTSAPWAADIHNPVPDTRWTRWIHPCIIVTSLLRERLRNR